MSHMWAGIRPVATYQSITLCSCGWESEPWTNGSGKPYTAWVQHRDQQEGHHHVVQD